MVPNHTQDDAAPDHCKALDASAPLDFLNEDFDEDFDDEDDEDEEELLAEKVDELNELVRNFTTNFPAHTGSNASSATAAKNIVLVTGTTGALGAELVSCLLSLPDIDCVYALNRKGSKPVHERQREGLSRRGLDEKLVDSAKLKLLEGDTAAKDLGLSNDLLTELQNSVTLIIHNAWRVNFMLSVASFKPLLAGVRHLIDFSLGSHLKSPPKLVYLSTVGVFRNWRRSDAPQEISVQDPAVAVGTGYMESKWVAEHIIEAAVKSRPEFNATVIRLGQLTSNASGAWNESDWLPSIVRSGQVLGILPQRNDKVAWISMDVAARVICELSDHDSPYFHLSNPSLVPWNTIFQCFSTELDIPLVSWSEWLRKLSGSFTDPQAMKRNPALHLLDLFSAADEVEGREAPGAAIMDLKGALELSETLSGGSMPRTVDTDVRSWIKYWRSTGFLD